MDYDPSQQPGEIGFSRIEWFLQKTKDSEGYMFIQNMYDQLSRYGSQFIKCTALGCWCVGSANIAEIFWFHT